jgi:hypothetical protein
MKGEEARAKAVGVIDLKTAKPPGFTLPPSLLPLADQALDRADRIGSPA